MSYLNVVVLYESTKRPFIIAIDGFLAKILWYYFSRPCLEHTYYRENANNINFIYNTAKSTTKVWGTI